MLDSLYKIQVGGVDSVQAFLSVSQFENGNPCIMKEIDFKDIISEAASQLKMKAENKKLEYIVDIPTEGNFTLMGDKTYLSNAVLNLIDNAIRYTPKGSVTVGLSMVSNNSVLFSVKDTGKGITEEDKKLLFTKYGHGKNSREVNVDSNGLGLYLVKKVVEAHNGKVWEESELGKGTTFFIKLPLNQSLKA